MPRALTSTDLARIQTAQRALLSPLAAPSVDAWRVAVMQALRPVFGSDGATFALPGAPTYFLADGVDDAVVRGIESYLTDPWLSRPGAPDPMVVTFQERVRARGIEVWDWETIDWIMDGTARTSTFYQEVMVPGGLAEQYTLHALRGTESSTIFVHEAPAATRPDAALVRPLLRTLVPAFKAGLDALDRLVAQRHALDALAEPAVVYDADGRECHRTAALSALLAADPERERVEGALRLLAPSLRALAFPLHADGVGGAPAVPQREAATARGRYTLRGALVPPGLFTGRETFLVTVEPPHDGLVLSAS